MNRPTACATVLAAGVLALPLSALADASGHVTMTQVLFQLVDLDPDDGVTPSVTFPSSFSPSGIGVNLPTVVANVGDTANWVPAEDYGTYPFGAVSLTNAVPGASASASFSGDPLAAGASFEVTASCVEGSLHDEVQADANASMVYNGGPGSFVLSPHTQLILSALVSGEVSFTTPALDAQTAFAFGSAFLQVSGTTPGPLIDNEEMSWEVDSSEGLSGSDGGTGPLSVTISNTTATSLDGYYFADAESLTSSGPVFPPPPPPAPEPGSVSLLLAGLAVVAGVRRRLQGQGSSRPACGVRASR